MTPTLLSQSPWRNVHNYFNDARSLTHLLPILLVIAAIIAVVLLINRVQQRRSAGRLDDDPAKLFRTVIRRLPLTVFQRDLLHRMARDLSLDQPAVMLLGPHLFAEQVRVWIDGQGQTDPEPPGGSVPPPSQLQGYLDGLSIALFATGLPEPAETDTVTPSDTGSPSGL